MSDYCTGGWCQFRNRCAAYAFTPSQRSADDIRLCPKGKEVPRTAPVMSLNERIAHHVAMAEAHQTMVQGLKYPQTVAASAVHEAAKKIQDAARAPAHVSAGERA